VEPLRLVCCLQAGGGLEAEVQSVFHWHRATPVQRLGQQLARQTLGHQVDQPVGSLAQLVDSGNVEMADSGSMAEALAQEVEGGGVLA
jgi:hypothetical protein